jgi:alpha-mannosidase
MIAHSHCDPGWLNTFEGYYLQEVKTILDSILRELQNNPIRKFVWSETSYFHRWYETQSQSSKSTFKRLVSDGQIEFVGGGWSQHDEANPDIIAMINQMTLGHDYLYKNFGITPKIAWQIDPFGHSSVTPTIFNLMGYESLVINRIHHQLKNYFKQEKTMEFLWRG